MFKKIKRCITYLLMITIVMTMIPITEALAGTNDNNIILEGEYVVISKLSNKSIEVANYGSNVGDLIQQWTYGGASQQQWSFEKVDNEYFKIVSKISSKVIEVKDSLTHDGAEIQQNDFSGADNQLWYFEKDSNGYIKIKSKQSEKCLDIKDYSSDDGAKLQLWTDNDGDNQKWKLIKINKNISNGNKYIFKCKRADKLMQVAGNSKENGACIEQWDYNSDNSQTWIVTEITEGYYSITSDNSKKVIDVRNTDTQDGTTIYQWDYNGQDNQLWYFEEDGEGYCKIKSKQSGKCLDIEGISSENGAKVQLWSDVDGDNQKWKMISLEDDSDEDGLINSKEVELGTDILKFDTDNDGLYDNEEIENNTNPLLRDTDGDGLTDGTVVKINVDPSKVGKDDTTDTDGDGVPDVKELTNKTEKEFNGYKYVVWNFQSNPAIADWITDKSGNLIVAPFYSEKYIDSDNTFSANEMSDAIKKITASMNNFVDESYLSDMKAKDRTKIVNNAVLYYLQKGGYDSTLWRMLNLKEDFSSILAFKLDMLTDEYKKYHKTHVIDPKTGNDIDFTHLAASLNAHYINDESYATMPIELTSWGGDLQTLLVDIADDSMGKSDINILLTSCEKLLGSQENLGSFDIADMLADIDAVNLVNELRSNTSKSLYKVFLNYYENGKCYTRFTQFINYYGKDGLKNKILEVIPDDKVITESNVKPVFWSKITLDYYLMKSYFCDENYHFKYWPTISTVKSLRDYFYKYVEIQANLE